MDLRDQHQRRVLEVAPQLRAVCRLAAEVELVANCLLELRHDCARLQALAFLPQPLDEHRGRVHQCQIVLDNLDDFRAQHFDGNLRAGFRADGVRQLREMNLRHRCARNGDGIE